MNKSRFSNAAALVRTLPRLGASSLLRVAMHRARHRLGLFRSPGKWPEGANGAFFEPIAKPDPAPKGAASDSWLDEALYFGHFRVPLGKGPPDWHYDPIAGERVSGQSEPWWRTREFARAGMDIKSVWEASRFQWSIPFAQRARNGEHASLERLNAWLDDWWRSNPPCLGVNWSCGQEASLRVLHLAMAAIILGQSRATTARLLDLVEAHCRRISETTSYALAQDNNHGVAEAAALFVGGNWLALGGRSEGTAFERKGLGLLLDRIERLIAPDGGFSMYSVAYHREVVDVFAMAEIWRRHHGMRELPDAHRSRLRAATLWLWDMWVPGAAEMPAIGAVDGSCLLPLSAADHQDAGGTLSVAAGLFLAGAEGGQPVPRAGLLRWFGIDEPDAPLPSRESGKLHDDSGFAILRRPAARAVCFMRYPRFRFRPNQADALHVDLWVGGGNLLRDAGSYSYNGDARSLRYFPGTESHNTVQFDGRDQMPRLGRFLFGDWLETDALEPIEEGQGRSSFGAGYRDRHGASHFRRLVLSDGSLRVEDRIAGFAGSAILRWRLAPGNWRLEGNRVGNGTHALEVRMDAPIARIELVEGWESRYYLRKTPSPVLEIEVANPGNIVSEYRWNL